MTDEQNPDPKPDSKFDPMREISRISNTVGKAIGQGIQQVQTQVRSLASVGSVRLDVYEYDNHIVVQTSPFDGELDPETLSVTMEGEKLTISGITRPDPAPLEANYLLQERKFGTFSRTVEIAIPVKADEAKAKFKQRTLTVTIPIDTQQYHNIHVIPGEE